MKNWLKSWRRAWPAGFAAAILLISPEAALADAQYGVTVAHAGAQSNNVGYVNFTVALTNSCAFNNLYVDLTNDGGRAMWSVILTARASGKTISAVGYTKDASGLCYVNLAEL